jgi:hypothetical protein
MKILLLIAFIFSAVISGFGQTPQLPSNPPNPNQRDIDPKKLRLLKPADLQVTAVSVTGFLHSASSGAYTFTLSISTKNFGDARTNAVKLRAWVKTATGTWKAFGGLITLTAINGGQTISGEYSFKDLEKLVSSGPFDVKVQADHGNYTTESNETNNYSTIIRINPASY